MKIISYFLIFLIFSSCTHKSVYLNECYELDSDRNPSSVRCENLISPVSRSALDDSRSIIDVGGINDKIKKSIRYKLKLVKMLLPASMDDGFWKIVKSISLNNDSKFSLSSSEIKLTIQVNTENNLVLKYLYDTSRDSFIISKVESVNNGISMLVSDRPFDYSKQELNPNLNLDIITGSTTNEIQSLQIADQIPYSLYKILDLERKNLELFTSNELLEISNKSKEIRAINYTTLMYSRKMKKYFFDDLIEKVFLNPIKTILISSVSVYAMSHFNEMSHQNFNLKVNQQVLTPAWVAPSVVKMAIRYPSEVQPDILRLMKVISSKNFKSINSVDYEKTINLKKIKIDESDYLNISTNKETKKTIFTISHQAENGSTDFYAIEIDPKLFPYLIKYFNKQNM